MVTLFAYLALIIDLMGIGIVYPLMAEFFSGEEGKHLAEGLSLNLRYFYLSLIFLLHPAAAFFSQPLSADLTKRYGIKNVLLLCMFGLFVSFALMGIGIERFSLLFLLIGRFLSGFMSASQTAAQHAIMQTRPSAVQNRMLALVLSIGIVLGPLFGGVLSDTALSPFLTFSTPFFAASGIALIIAFGILYVFRSKRPQLQHSIDWLRPFHVFIKGLKDHDLQRLAGVFFCTQLGFAFFYQLIQIFVSDYYDFSTWKIGVYNGFLGFAFAISALGAVDWGLKFLGIRKLALYSLFLAGLLLILAMLYPERILFWVLTFFVALFNMMAYAALLNAFSVSSARSRAVIAGLMGTLVAIAWILAALSINFTPLLGIKILIGTGGAFMLFGAFQLSKSKTQRR